MKIGVIDTETTHLDNTMGNVVEVALVEVDTDTKTIKSLFNSLASPGGMGSTHGIRLEDSWICQNGIIKPEEIRRAPHEAVVATGLKFFLDNKPWTTYNLSFDQPFLTRFPYKLPRSTLPCIMLSATEACKIPSNRDDVLFKWPSLDEAYEILCNSRRMKGHRALDDALDAAAVLLHLIEMGFYQLPTEIIIENAKEIVK